MGNKKNIEKTNAIVTMRVANPELTLQEIGTYFNLTRERIRQILVSANVETRSSHRIEILTRPYPVCVTPKCENTVPRRGRQYCISCLENGTWIQDMGLRRRRIPQVTVQCNRCNKDISMRETLLNRQRSRYKNMYCSQKCRSTHVWEQQKVKNVSGRIVRVQLGQ